MARSKLNQQNIDNSNPSLYLQGRIKDNTGSGDGTPVSEAVYGDIHQTLAKVMDLYNISYNGLPDNEQNGYQFIEALIALASKNDFILNLTATGGKLSLPVKIAPLKTGESFIAKASVDYNEETEVRGSLDNSSKAVEVEGEFLTGEYVRIEVTSTKIRLVRIADAVSFVKMATDSNLLTAATQAEENTGTTEEKATTPKTNKSVFTRRVTGVESDNYLAGEENNGLLSKEFWAILNDIGNSRVRNVGSFGGFDVNDLPPGSSIATEGDITNAVKTATVGSGDLIEVTFANAMDNTKYKLHCSVQSQGTIGRDNDIRPIVWKPISTNTAQILVEGTDSGVQNIKIHLDVIQL